MNVLVVGRFQPLHKGHVALLKHAASLGALVVAIGSSQEAGTKRNPFSAQVRRDMVQTMFPNATIVLVPDVGDPPRYAKHVLALTGPVDVVVGHDMETLGLFSEHALLEHVQLLDREQFQGAVIRKQLESNGPWQDAVPAALHGLVTKHWS